MKQGQMNQGMKFFKKYPTFEVWEGITSLMILNKGKEELEINGIKVRIKNFFFFKGHTDHPERCAPYTLKGGV